MFGSLLIHLDHKLLVHVVDDVYLLVDQSQNVFGRRSDISNVTKRCIILFYFNLTHRIYFGSGLNYLRFIFKFKSYSNFILIIKIN